MATDECVRHRQRAKENGLVQLRQSVPQILVLAIVDETAEKRLGRHKHSLVARVHADVHALLNHLLLEVLARPAGHSPPLRQLLVLAGEVARHQDVAPLPDHRRRERENRLLQHDETLFGKGGGQRQKAT